jgi:histidine ammonia-lyase
MVPCTQAYANHGLQHVTFEGKEYLGVLNGTSFSAAVASLVLGDALQMGMIAMVCTAMGTEALLGTQGPYSPSNGTRKHRLIPQQLTMLSSFTKPRVHIPVKLR